MCETRVISHYGISANGTSFMARYPRYQTMAMELMFASVELNDMDVGCFKTDGTDVVHGYGFDIRTNQHVVIKFRVSIK
jgi:hypothetical protein